MKPDLKGHTVATFEAEPGAAGFGMIPDVPYRFTIRPLPEDEGGGCLIDSRSPWLILGRPYDRGSDH